MTSSCEVNELTENEENIKIFPNFMIARLPNNFNEDKL